MTTWYVNPDGTKDATTIAGLFSAQNIEPGDVIEIQAQTAGGSETYTETTVIQPAAGDTGSVAGYVTIRPRAGDTITVTGSGIANVWDLRNVDYYRIQGPMTLSGGTTSTIYTGSASRSNLQFINLTIDSPKTGIFIGNTTGNGLNQATIQDVTINDVASGGWGIYFGANVVLTNTLFERVTVSTTVSGPGFYSAGPCTFTGTTFKNCRVTGCDGAGGNAFQFIGTSGVVLENCKADNNSQNGFLSQDNSTLTCYDCIADNNDNDGFSASVNSANITCWRCESVRNGSTGATGDGFTAHANNTLNMYYCLSADNLNTGVGVINDSKGNIYNCTFSNNGGTLTRKTNIWLSANGVWTVKNCITNGTTNAVQITADAITGGITATLSNNIYGENAFLYNGVANNFSQWVTSSGEANSQQSSPELRRDYKLIAGSPSIGSGETIVGFHDSNTVLDKSGKAIHGIPDIGCYEYLAIRQGVW